MWSYSFLVFGIILKSLHKNKINWRKWEVKNGKQNGNLLSCVLFNEEHFYPFFFSLSFHIFLISQKGGGKGLMVSGKACSTGKVIILSVTTIKMHLWIYVCLCEWWLELRRLFGWNFPIVHQFYFSSLFFVHKKGGRKLVE